MIEPIDDPFGAPNVAPQIASQTTRLSYIVMVVYALFSGEVLLLVSFLCALGSSWKNLTLLPFVLEWQRVCCILLSWIHQTPCPGWNTRDFKIVSIPYGKQMFARPSYHSGAYLAFLVVISYLHPVLEVALPLITGVYVEALSNWYMGFATTVDVGYGFVVGGVVASVVYCTGFTEFVSAQPGWLKFVILAMPIPFSYVAGTCIPWIVPGAASAHKEGWVAKIKSDHPSSTFVIGIDDRQMDILYPIFARLLGLSIGASIVANDGLPPLYLVAVGTAVFLILGGCIEIAKRRSFAWAEVLANFALGCWVYLIFMIN